MARDLITLTQLLAALRGQVEILEQRGDVSCPVHAMWHQGRYRSCWWLIRARRSVFSAAGFMGIHLPASR